MKSYRLVLCTLLLSTFILGGCAASAQKMRMSDLQDTVGLFNQHLRWKRCQMATPMVAPELQAIFMENCDELTEDLGIEESTIYSIVLEEENTKATARMRFAYYQLPRNNLIKKSATITWRKNGTGWLVTGGTGAFYDELFTDKLENKESEQSSVPDNDGDDLE